MFLWRCCSLESQTHTERERQTFPTQELECAKCTSFLHTQRERTYILQIVSVSMKVRDLRVCLTESMVQSSRRRCHTPQVSNQSSRVNRRRPLVTFPDRPCVFLSSRRCVCPDLAEAAVPSITPRSRKTSFFPRGAGASRENTGSFGLACRVEGRDVIQHGSAIYEPPPTDHQLAVVHQGTPGT